MKFKIIGVAVILASFSIPSQGLPFEDFGLASVAEYEVPKTELRRDKRTLTTICVEIKPSSPYEEPYYMCKGTDSPKYSKGSTSDSYSSKPSYKPPKPSTYVSGESDSYHSGLKKNNEYHAPSKPEYHEEHSKYDKPASYDSAKEYSSPSKPSYGKNPSHADSHGIHHSDSYSSYDVPSKPSSYSSTKPSYADHDSHDDYAQLHHKVTYEKPSAPTYSSKPQTFSHENPSEYDHRQPAGYSKPSSYESHTAPAGGYSKPSSSYEHTEYSKPSSHDYSSAHDTNPSYNGDHSKPSYGGHDGHSYSAPPETKVLYSKPSSYPAKQTSYEHADNTHYGQPKPSYSEQPPSKPYSKPAQDYGKPAPYAPTEHQHSGYAPQPHNYRMMSPDLIQPTWEPQPQPNPQQLQYDGFGYRSYGAPMEYQNLETPRMMNPESQLNTGLEGPLRFDLSDTDQEAPTLQSAYQHQTYSSHAYHDATYGPPPPTYATPPAHYAPAAPLYPGPVYPSAAPSYAPVQTPSYVPLSVPSPSYAPAHPSYAPASPSYGSPVPACGQNYMYSFQPVVMSVPCYSMSAGYSSSTYGQALGAPANPQIVHASNLNPLQDHISSARSEANSEPSMKNTDDHSGSEESHESDKKSDSQVETISQTTAAKKSENLKKPSDIAEEKHQKEVDGNSQDQVVAAEKPIANESQTAVATPQKNTEVPNTQEAYNAMMKMARIAAQLNKEDTNKGPTDSLGAGSTSTGQGNEKSSGALPQFSRSK